MGSHTTTVALYQQTIIMKELLALFVALTLFFNVESHSPKKILKVIHAIVNENKETLNEVRDSLNQGCSDDWQFFNQTKLCYIRFSANELVLKQPGWMGARLYCIEQGGDLAVILNE